MLPRMSRELLLQGMRKQEHWWLEQAEPGRCVVLLHPYEPGTGHRRAFPQSRPSRSTRMFDDTQRGDGAVQSPLPNLLQRTHEVQDDQIRYRFGNGLVIKTEILRKPDRLRILPLGTPQGSLMNHMLHFPEVTQGKDVFEPFAGSGALGFMALKLGAHHVDFLDVNPRAVTFQVENAALNHFLASQYSAIQ